ncbi:hypothetical protein TNCV_2533781 [Trichonephila clavipes]|nr:hypothetical protein TNCV_2533781 [Trichonephila clavipes]
MVQNHKICSPRIALDNEFNECTQLIFPLRSRTPSSSHKCTTSEAISELQGSVCRVKKTPERKSPTCLFVDHQRCHEFEPSTTKDPPCRGKVPVKSIESSSVLLLEWCGAKRGQLKYRPRHLTMVQNYEVLLQKPSCS